MGSLRRGVEAYALNGVPATPVSFMGDPGDEYEKASLDVDLEGVMECPSNADGCIGKDFFYGAIGSEGAYHLTAVRSNEEWSDEGLSSFEYVLNNYYNNGQWSKVCIPGTPLGEKICKGLVPQGWEIGSL